MSAGGVGRVGDPGSQWRVPLAHDASQDVSAEPVGVLVERVRHGLHRLGGADDERGVGRLLVGRLTLAHLVDAGLVHPGDEQAGQAAEELPVLGSDRQHLGYVVGVGVVDRVDRHGWASRAGVDVGGQSVVIRWAPAYTLRRLPRTKPSRLIPASSAHATAKDDGAETAARQGIPAMIAFWVSSNDARPDTTSTHPTPGTRPLCSAHPTTLSTALCRPTSSRTVSSSPSAVKRPAAWSPPVLSNDRCSARSASGSSAMTLAANSVASERTSNADCARSCSMLALPHTPHDELVKNARVAEAAGAATPGARVTSMTL